MIGDRQCHRHLTIDLFAELQVPRLAAVAHRLCHWEHAPTIGAWVASPLVALHAAGITVGSPTIGWPGVDRVGQTLGEFTRQRRWRPVFVRPE